MMAYCACMLAYCGNLQVCMYCMHAQKGGSEAPRTHFRACKVYKFSERVPPDPLTKSLLWALLFVSALGPSNPNGGSGSHSELPPEEDIH